MKRLSKVIAALALLSGPFIANAQMLIYQGEPLSSVIYSPPEPPEGWQIIGPSLPFDPYSPNSIYAEFTPQGPITANGTFSATGMMDFAGVPISASGTFTETNGVMTAWSFFGRNHNDYNGAYDYRASISSNGDSFSGSIDVAIYPSDGIGCSPGGGFCGFTSASYQGSNGTPGAWNIPSFNVAPEIDSASACAALTLLVGSLTVIRGRRTVPRSSK